MGTKLDITPIAKEIYAGANSKTSPEDWASRRRKLRQEVEQLVLRTAAPREAVVRYLSSVDRVADKAEAHFGKKDSPMRDETINPDDYSGSEFATIEPAEPTQKRPFFGSRITVAPWLLQAGQWILYLAFLLLVLGMVVIITQINALSFLLYWPYVTGLVAVAVVTIPVWILSRSRDWAAATGLSAICVALAQLAYQPPGGVSISLDWAQSSAQAIFGDIAPVPTPDPVADRKVADLLEGL